MYSVYQDQGMRDYMEDTFDVEQGFYKDYDYYAVFDGHGGDAVSLFLQANLKNAVRAHLAAGATVEQALFKGFDDVAAALPAETSVHTGSTALVMVRNKKRVWVANAGDCRAVLKRFDKTRYTAVAITTDHKPNLPSERDRIEHSGGFVMQDPFGTWRVAGNLAVSRSFGDAYLHPFVTWVPEVFTFPTDPDMRAVFLASDGVWDTVQNQEVAIISTDVINKHMQYNPQQVLNSIASTIGRVARAKGSGDNITVLMVVI